MALLRFRDVTSPDRQAELRAGIHAIDPHAAIDPDWATGVLEVTGSVPIETLCAALRMAGFRVEVVREKPRTVTTRDIVIVVAQTIGFAVLGGLLTTIIGGFLGYAYVGMNPSCAVISDDGPCAARMMMIATGAGMIGTLATALATATAGTLRLRHLHHTGENVPFLRMW